MNTTILSFMKVQLSKKMTKQALFVLFFFLTMAFTTKTQAENLVQCPGFECETYTANWNVSAGVGATVGLSATARTGSNSAVLTVPTSGSSISLYQVITGITADQKYKFSAYFSNPSSESIEVGLRILYYRNNSSLAASGGLLDGTFTIPAGGGWVQQSIGHTAPSNANRVRVYVQASNAAVSFLVDDLSLEAGNSITGFSDIFKAIGDADFELTAVTNSGGTISYTIADPSIATISGSTVHILQAGRTTITASAEDVDPVTVNFIVKEDSSRGVYYRVEDFSTASDGWYTNLGREGTYSNTMTTDFMTTNWSTLWTESVARVKLVDDADADAAFLKHEKNSLLILPAAETTEVSTVSVSFNYSSTSIFSNAKKITIYFAGSQSSASDFEALAPNPTIGYENFVLNDFDPAVHSYQLTITDNHKTNTVSSPQYNDRGVWHKWVVEPDGFTPVHFGVSSSIRGTAVLKYGEFYGYATSSVSLGTPVIIGAIIVDWDSSETPTAGGFYPQNLQAQTISGLSDIQVAVGGKVKLKATADSGEEVLYLIDDVNGVATLANGDSIVGLAIGETTLTAIQAGTSEYASIIKTVKVTVTETQSGLWETNNNVSFALQSNPVQNEARFSFESASNGANIVIIDLTGKTVASEVIASGATEASVNVSSLSKGVYIARYTDNAGKTGFLKLIK